MSYINNLLKLASRFEWKVKLAQSDLAESDLERNSYKSIAQEEIEIDDFQIMFLSDYNSYTKIVSYIITFHTKLKKRKPVQLAIDIPEKDSLGLEEDYNIIMKYLLKNCEEGTKVYNIILNDEKFKGALLNLLATTEEARENYFVDAPL